MTRVESVKPFYQTGKLSSSWFSIGRNLKMGISVGLLFTLMIIELGVGLLSGIVIKEAAKFTVRSHSENRRIFRKDQYSSRHFDNRFPDGFFNTFNLNQEFIIVSYNNDEVVSEDFYTLLGDHVKAEYNNGNLQAVSTTAWSSPTYTLATFIPGIIGFVLSVIALLRIVYTHSFSILVWDKLGFYLLISSLLWYMSLYWVPTLIKALNRATNFSE